MLNDLFWPASSTESTPDLPLSSDRPHLEEVRMEAARKKPPKCPSIPILSAAVEVALEKCDQKDCLALSGVQDSGDDRKDFIKHQRLKTPEDLFQSCQSVPNG